MSFEDKIELLSRMGVEAQQKTISRSLPNRLIPEILGEVFRAFRGDDYSYCLLPITHVCRHWRAVAISERRLWCKPGHSNPTLVAEMIHRSEGTGLHLVLISNRCSEFGGALPPRGHNWDNALCIQLANLEQAVSIIVDIDSGTFANWFYNLHRPAPLLESLDIYNAWFLHSDADLMKFFQGHAPRLQRLALHQCNLYCAPSLFQNLRSFSMRWISATCSKLLTVLRSAPLLEHLTIHALRLRHSKGEVTEVVRERPEIVRLPHLWNLSLIDGSLCECVHIISHLRVAQPITVIMEEIVNDVQTERLPLAMQIIDSLITGGSMILPKSASFDLNSNNLSLCLWDTDKQYRSSLSILPSLRLDSWKHWYRHLSLSEIRDLTLWITLPNSEWSRTDIPELLGSMTQVETLHLYNNCVMQMIPLLATKQRTQRPGHPGLFPSLTCLKISDGFRDKRPNIMKSLLPYVRERYEEGAPIRQLSVHERLFPDVDIQAKLERFVAKLSHF
ncbi:hypothetical protein NEOLEDRAFT_1119268 [Neolentinus lepideus HHB14362 ss-1]|uniref:Uncharacterized protein n=1 Tax=Neolentinus lepideus HHB14362 ss-1 TaxID=1314782 RepID=A0A165QNS5_9AGAM|nr:hypothetical protein NEOLEDRAFT_1119268 [Neolentinus lepideus HHB14362 ss-1]